MYNDKQEKIIVMVVFLLLGLLVWKSQDKVGDMEDNFDDILANSQWMFNGSQILYAFKNNKAFNDGISRVYDYAVDEQSVFLLWKL